MDAFTPAQTIELVARTGCKKAHMRIDKLFWNSFMAGPLLGFGCAILLSVNASPWYEENAPGLLRMLGALLFPYMTTAYLSRRIALKDVAKSWIVSFIGNLAGSLFSVAILFGYSGVFTESDVYSQACIRIATEKVVNPHWHQIFLRAIGANWLVCFAVFNSIQAREMSGKIMAIWWPTATFVGLALDHTIANEFIIPTGIWVGAPISVGLYIYKSMIASALGNAIGGGLFVGTSYWYLYLTGEAGIHIAFDVGGAQSAVEGGVGPMRLRQKGNTGSGGGGGMMTPIEGRPPPGEGMGGGMVMSGLGHEMGDDGPYAGTYMDRMKEKEAEAQGSNGTNLVDSGV